MSSFAQISLEAFKETETILSIKFNKINDVGIP